MLVTSLAVIDSSAVRLYPPTYLLRPRSLSLKLSLVSYTERAQSRQQSLHAVSLVWIDFRLGRSMSSLEC